MEIKIILQHSVNTLELTVLDPAKQEVSDKGSEISTKTMNP